ncbi:MAG: hypothetical protein HYZ43_11125 [Flavobacteriia bacterium]|nr:hypothetical protein [Flavobacteriia bacterium]
MGALQKSGSKAGSGSISVFGTKDWANFEDICGVTKNKFNLHWASANDLNYNLPETKKMLRQFRRKFKCDMSKYSAHGFDVMYHFATTLLMDKPNATGVINNFDLQQVGEGNGFENNQAYILKHVDFELERVGSLHE